MSTWLVWLLGVAGSVVVLVVRHMVKPAARPATRPPQSRDWSSFAFGLDLIVASFIAAPAALALRQSVEDRLAPVKDAVLPKLASDHGLGESVNGLFSDFFETPQTVAVTHLMYAILIGLAGVSVYMVAIRGWGYEVNVPKGCSHPALRIRGLVLDNMIGVAVALGITSVARTITL